MPQEGPAKPLPIPPLRRTSSSRIPSADDGFSLSSSSSSIILLSPQQWNLNSPSYKKMMLSFQPVVGEDEEMGDFASDAIVAGVAVPAVRSRYITDDSPLNSTLDSFDSLNASFPRELEAFKRSSVEDGIEELEESSSTGSIAGVSPLKVSLKSYRIKENLSNVEAETLYEIAYRQGIPPEKFSDPSLLKALSTSLKDKCAPVAALVSPVEESKDDESVHLSSGEYERCAGKRKSVLFAKFQQVRRFDELEKADSFEEPEMMESVKFEESKSSVSVVKSWMSRVTSYFSLSE